MFNMFDIVYHFYILFLNSPFFDYLFPVFYFAFFVTIPCLIRWFFKGD